jgi:putative flippase GtrA
MNLIKAWLSSVSLPKDFLIFLCVGILGYLLSLGLLIFLKEILLFHHLIAWQIAWFSTNFVTFYLNKRYTFNSKKSFWKEIWKYYLSNSVHLLIASLSFIILVDIFGMWYVTATIVISFILMFYSYFIHKLWSFK